MTKVDIRVLPVGELQANCYILNAQGSDKAVIVDPGDDADLIKRALASLNLVPECILLTHGHYDHMLSAAHLKNEFGLKVCIHEKDAVYLTDRSYNLCPDQDAERFLPISPDGLIPEGDFEVCGIHFTVIPTPGHTPGGVCLYLENQKTLISGDTLFSNGFGRTDFVGGDWLSLCRSLKTLFNLPPETFVYPGHGAGAPVGDIRKGFYR